MLFIKRLCMNVNSCDGIKCSQPYLAYILSRFFQVRVENEKRFLINEPMIHKSRILVVDDNEGILQMMRVMLERAGYEVFTENDPSMLHDDLKQNPDLIMLDIFMSGVDGREICKSLKSDSNTRDIPIVMLSASFDLADSVTDCGAEAFIEKPFEMKYLLEKLKTLIPN